MTEGHTLKEMLESQMRDNMYDKDSGYRGVDDDDDMENYAMDVVDDDPDEDKLGGIYKEYNMRDDF